jgi:hypothetical protein
MGKTQRAIAPERRPIIHLECPRQAMANKQLEQNPASAGVIFRCQLLDCETVARSEIEDRQWLQFGAGALAHRSFEVDRPNVVRPSGQNLIGPTLHRPSLSSLFALTRQSTLSQPTLQGAHTRATGVRPLPTKFVMQFFRAPGRTLLSPREQSPTPIRLPLMGLMRSATTHFQTVLRIMRVTPPPFITRLSTDPMHSTQRGETPALGRRFAREAPAFRFVANFFPGHIALAKL